MKYFVLVLCLFFVFVNLAASDEPDLNLAVQTEIQFDNKDLTFVDKIENFLRRLKGTLTGNQSSRRNEDSRITFRVFVNDLVHELGTLGDTDLRHVYDVAKNEIKKIVNHVENTELRRFIEKQHVPAANHIRDFANKLSIGFTAPGIVDIFDNVYFDYSDKFRAVLDDIRQYKLKSKRFNIDLSKIIRNGIKTLISDRVDSIKESDKKNLSFRLNSFWNSNIRDAISSFFSSSNNQKPKEKNVSEIQTDSASESSESLGASPVRSKDKKNKVQRETTRGRLQTLWVEERTKRTKNMVETDSDFIEDEKDSENKQSGKKQSGKKQRGKKQRGKKQRGKKQSEEIESEEKYGKEKESKEKRSKEKANTSSSEESDSGEANGKIRSYQNILRNKLPSIPSKQTPTNRKFIKKEISKADVAKNKTTRSPIKTIVSKDPINEESSSKEISIVEHEGDVSSSREHDVIELIGKQNTKEHTSKVVPTVSESKKKTTKERASKDVQKVNTSNKNTNENVSDESSSTDEVSSKEHVSGEKPGKAESEEDVTNEEQIVSTKKITTRKRKTIKTTKTMLREGTTKSVTTKKRPKSQTKKRASPKTLPLQEKELSFENTTEKGKEIKPNIDIAKVLERMHDLEIDIAMMKNKMEAQTTQSETRKNTKPKETSKTTSTTVQATPDAIAETSEELKTSISSSSSMAFDLTTLDGDNNDDDEDENYRRAYKETNYITNNVTETTTLFEIKATTLKAKQTDIVNIDNTTKHEFNNETDSVISANNVTTVEVKTRRDDSNKTFKLDNNIELDNDVLTFPVNFTTAIEFTPFSNNTIVVG